MIGESLYYPIKSYDGLQEYTAYSSPILIGTFLLNPALIKTGLISLDEMGIRSICITVDKILCCL